MQAPHLAQPKVHFETDTRSSQSGNSSKANISVTARYQWIHRSWWRLGQEQLVLNEMVYFKDFLYLVETGNEKYSKSTCLFYAESLNACIFITSWCNLVL